MKVNKTIRNFIIISVTTSVFIGVAYLAYKGIKVIKNKQQEKENENGNTEQ